MSDPPPDPRASIAGWLDIQAVGCRAMGSEFYADLCVPMAADAREGGPVFEVLADHAAEPFETVYALRVLGGVHRMVLEGRAPDLARHFPSVGGDGDAAAAWPPLRALLASHPPEVLDSLTRPPQTNEVFRSTALVGGFLTVAAETELPLRVLEVGASAGLNLRFDHFRYEQDGRGFGPPDSQLRFVDVWQGGVPPLDAPLEVVERVGCDRDPIDPTTDAGRITLLSYLWPGQASRFETLERAIEVARRVEARVEQADLFEWIDTQLARPRPGVATVVYQSIVFQYLGEEGRNEELRRLAAAGARATTDAPVAWLRLEPQLPRMSNPELRLTTWPGGDERLLATASFHVGPVTWLAAP